MVTIRVPSGSFHFKTHGTAPHDILSHTPKHVGTVRRSSCLIFALRSSMVSEKDFINVFLQMPHRSEVRRPRRPCNPIHNPCRTTRGTTLSFWGIECGQCVGLINLPQSESRLSRPVIPNLWYEYPWGTRLTSWGFA
jgi:hypothetical protein